MVMPTAALAADVMELPGTIAADFCGSFELPASLFNEQAARQAVIANAPTTGFNHAFMRLRLVLDVMICVLCERCPFGICRISQTNTCVSVADHTSTM